MKILLTLALLLMQNGGSIEGLIEDVPDARVLLTRIDGRLVDSLTVTADREGRFKFSGLASGSYRLFAVQDGFVRAEFGQRVPEGRGMPLTLAAGQEMKGVVVKMTPTGAITGRVLSPSGEPVRLARIVALKSAYFDGERIMTPVSETHTNDLGQYRIHTLPPGTYWIRAFPGSGQRIENGEIVGWTTKSILARGEFVDPSAFNPNPLREALLPASIDVRPGEIFRADDLVLSSGRGSRIRGQTINSATNQPVVVGSVSINRNSNDGTQEYTRNTVADPLLSSRTPTSSFEFADLPPGSYVLTANMGNMAARMSLEVRNDIDDLRLMLHATLTLKGRVRVEGSALTNEELNALNVRFLGTDISPSSVPSCDGTCRSYLVPVISARLSADRSFTMTGVEPGNYRVELRGAPSNAYVKSGDQVRIDESTSSLEIVVGNAFGTIEATTAPAATVVIVPESSRSFELYRTGITGPDGRVRIEKIVPGNYKVFAWQDIEMNAWQHPDVLKQYGDRGIPIRVAENSINAVEVPVIR